MIVFESVRWKNFLSTGDKMTEVQLNRSPSTLIVGHNGAGKSTLLDALSFALFGKPHRDIKKPQLINSINNKNCEVEVEFSIGKTQFKIARGIKPGKFEIYQNNKLVNQESNARDYQKFLEQNILKLNHKSFHQIVVLGSSSFIPFMQLAAGHRREVIEDLLDIGVFSKMNTLLKERSMRIKEQMKDMTYQMDLLNEKINLQRKYIRDITEINDGQIKEKRDAIASFQISIEELQTANNEYSTEIEKASQGLSEQLNKAHDKKQALLQYTAQFQQQIRTVVKDAKFYEDNDACPTCSQNIGEDLRREKLDSARSKAKELNEAVVHATEESTLVESTIERLTNISEQIRGWTSDISANNKEITRLQGQIRALENDISSLSSRDGDLGGANQKLSTQIEEKESLTERKLEINEQRTYYEACSEMLKDTGIKTKIIKEYLPVMNNLVNKYLQVLDFFVQFNLDENFNETIKSRHRDAFNYASFSEGEKQRIDLALLFTWRQIAKMKNSAATNLLILDETFDSSLDHDGVDNLMKILGTLEDDSNIFVISHKGDLLDGKFRSKIEFHKEHNFSKMVVSNG
jgi:DNA repair exonuclease SbcCD ATPase subunit